MDAPPAPACVAGPNGLVYADSEEEARVAASAMREAVESYGRYFGSAPTGVLVLSATLDPLVARDFARARGMDYAQVWLPARAKREMMARAMRQAGIGHARIRQAQATDAKRTVAVLRHELGHSMYAAMFWAGAEPAPSTRYGTPGPDWLDEAVAILMEPPESQADHLSSFIDAAKRQPQIVPALAEFVNAEHPVRDSALARALARGPKSGSGVQMIIADAGSPGIETFYGQSVLVALFLAQASGDPRILATVSRAVADGTRFERWLALEGERHGLPSDLPALQKLWDAWLLDEVLRPGRDGDR